LDDDEERDEVPGAVVGRKELLFAGSLPREEEVLAKSEGC